MTAEIGSSVARHASYFVGPIHVVVLADGTRTFPLTDDFITNATKAEINEALTDAGLPANQITTSYNPLLLKSDKRKVLIDTGNGAAALVSNPAGPGHLSESLLRAGVEASEIDTVVISHCHPDHIKGLLDANGAPAYPNATILVPSVEWSFWTERAPCISNPSPRIKKVLRANLETFDNLKDRVQVYWDGDEILDGVTAVETPGHSIGHMSFAVKAGSKEVFLQSDLTNTPEIFLRNPGWHGRFDQDPILAERTRYEKLQWLADTGIRVQGYHFPFPGCGYVEEIMGGYRLKPLALSEFSSLVN
jgi:glyoxylase-like metal-dependent hydrolase (beta-lactamase superfamily II)